MNQVAGNIAAIRERMDKAAQEAERDPAKISLVAVSKHQSREAVEAALKAGQMLFGENRVQEAQMHWEQLRPLYPDVRLHLIGPLQTNKVKDAVALFDCIETVDSARLAEKLAAEMDAQGRRPACFVQVNTGAEPQKAGVLPGDLGGLLDACRSCGLAVSGLMCIPPLEEPAALHFAFLKKLADDCGLAETSMGMSADFEKAIAAGATFIRVGTALFGERERSLLS